MGNNVVHTETVVLAREGQRVFEGYLARPESGQHPGILLLTEMWGITESKMELAHDLAARGWCALVPDIFWQAEHTGVIGEEGPGRADAMHRLTVYDYEGRRGDLVAAAAWLRNTEFCSGHVAALGFCIGGRLAFLAAAEGVADGAVSMYGAGIINHLDDISRITCPVQLHYGMADPHIPVEEVDKIAARASSTPSIEIFRYPAPTGHGFMNPTRAFYSSEVVALANSRIDKLLSQVKALDGENHGR